MAMTPEQLKSLAVELAQRLDSPSSPAPPGSQLTTEEVMEFHAALGGRPAPRLRLVHSGEPEPVSEGAIIAGYFAAARAAKRQRKVPPTPAEYRASITKVAPVLRVVSPKGRLLKLKPKKPLPASRQQCGSTRFSKMVMEERKTGRRNPLLDEYLGSRPPETDGAA